MKLQISSKFSTIIVAEYQSTMGFRSFLHLKCYLTFEKLKSLSITTFDFFLKLISLQILALALVLAHALKEI